MGAVTIANRREDVEKNKRVVECDVTFSASYATGGDTVSPALLGLRQVDRVSVPSHNVDGVAVSNAQAQAGKTFQLGGTASAPTLKAYDAAATEIANATNLSTITRRLRFIGS